MSTVLTNQVAQREQPQSSALLFLLTCYLFFVFVRPQDYPALSFELPILPTVQVLVLIAWLMSRPKFNTSQHAFVLLLMAWIPITLLANQSPRTVEISRDFIVTIGATFLFAASAAQHPEGIRRIAFVLCTSTLVMAADAATQFYGDGGVGFSGQEWLPRKEAFGTVYQARYVGIFGDPNDLGMILIMAVPWLFYFRHTAASSLKRFFWTSLILMHVVGLYLTNSRGTYLALAASFGVWLALRYRMTRAMVVTVLCLPVVLVVAPARLFVSNDQSTLDRIDAWYQGFQLFRWKPVFGVGAGLFKDYHHKAAHNSWIQLLSETGAIGYALWSGLLFSCLYLSYRMQLETSWSTVGSEESERILLARVSLLSLVAGLAAMFFLSRAYHLPIYLLCAVIVGQYMSFRMRNSPIRHVLRFSAIGSAVSLVAIYIVVRLYS